MNELPRVDRPQPMFGKCRMVRHGPWVPGRIWLDDSQPERPSILLAEINGKPVNVQAAWIRLFKNPITEAEFRFMTADSKWAAKNAPDDPAANPCRAVDFKTMTPPF